MIFRVPNSTIILMISTILLPRSLLFATIVEEVTRPQTVNTKMLFAALVGKKDIWQKSVEAKPRT